METDGCEDQSDIYSFTHSHFAVRGKNPGRGTCDTKEGKDMRNLTKTDTNNEGLRVKLELQRYMQDLR